MTDNIDKSILLKLTSAAVLSVSLTATTLVWFYENYRIPLKVVETTIGFKEIARKNEELKVAIEKEKNSHNSTKSKLNDTQLELGTLNERVQSQNLSIKALNQSNLFHSDSFYPVGFGAPKIGDSIDILNTMYKPADIEWRKPADEDWKVKITIKDGYFQTVEYDYDQTTKKVTGILFSTEFGFDKILLKRLSEIGGQPTRSRKYDIYRWFVSKGIYSFLVSGDTYMILNDGQAPALWREPTEP